MAHFEMYNKEIAMLNPQEILVLTPKNKNHNNKAKKKSYSKK
jgi:hypothetical protein